jgi:MOSC domain-containing protein YiiM
MRPSVDDVSMTSGARASVIAVSRDDRHRFSKPQAESIVLLAGLGVEGDAHCGATVKHRSRVAADPAAPNLRQVHLIPLELLEELRGSGYDIAPGQMGENITTSGLDVLALPRGTVLRIGADAAVEVTGLRNPCKQIELFRTGLLKHVVGRDQKGAVVRRAGVMGIVLRGGTVRPSDPIAVELPAEPHLPLQRV